MKTHLDRAKTAAEFAGEHVSVARLAGPALQRAIAHALIDIADTLRLWAAESMRTIPADRVADLPFADADDIAAASSMRSFGSRVVVRTITPEKALPILADLPYVPLENVGGTWDDEDCDA